MSYITNAILVFTPSGLMTPTTHAIGTINIVLERWGHLPFAGTVGLLRWGGDKNPQGIEVFCASFNYIDKKRLERLIRRVSRCILGKTYLFLHDAEDETGTLYQAFPRKEDL